ncbi:MAG: hypothetical protein ABI321_18370 [Polyangia bacterium]
MHVALWWIVGALALGVFVVSRVVAPRPAVRAPVASIAPPEPRTSGTSGTFDVTLTQIGTASPESAVFELVAHNGDVQPHVFCTYYTPFEGFLNDILDVVDASGTALRFTGPLASRQAPGPSSYVTLAPGESRVVRFDVVPSYPLRSGLYHISTRTGLATLQRSNALAVSVTSEADPRARELAVSLHAESGSTATFTVTNRGRDPQRFCTWRTPFDGMRSDFLEVVDTTGRPVAYRGKMARRGAPTAADFTMVAPGVR